MTSDLQFRPTDPQFLLNPYPWLAKMRQEAPVFYDKEQQAWMVFRYDDVERVSSQWKTFSSKSPKPLGREDFTQDLIHTDPPKHQSLRTLVQKVFTPNRVEALAPRITELTHELLDQMKQHKQVDLIQAFSSPLPIIVIGEILGVPLEDRENFKHWSDGVLGSDPTAIKNMADYFRQLLKERRSHPGQDLISDLIAAYEEGEKLTGQEVVDFCILLLTAGNETTTNLITNTIWCLHEHPDENQRLLHDLSLLPSAIEEVLRYYSPITFLNRFTQVETQIGDQTIPPGQLVHPWLTSANRDELHFENADRFIIDREPNKHFAFGNGIHFCLGAPLTRLEAKIGLKALLSEFPNLRVDSKEPLKPIPNIRVHGLESLSVLL
ncbi:cytochrome P450 [Brasilonema octagenarum UFV-E1]|uniref:Cytochrome P450 n=1 Tax=Brasilonema sennae CENA114 TaxID=415709 RepID=A0A856MKR9_9CYAN|nr:cytochrome P450 [Brasilonema sennae]QDL09526.1 cytochrome P450 [Brasilonema sennae CENA114]QDL18683.1 cytochrome P450 [Brasilonema octagenarum UFV-E1]